MSTNIANSRPSILMSNLAYEVCIKELRKKNLELMIKKLYPDDIVPDYSSLFQAVIDHLKVSLRRGFFSRCTLVATKVTFTIRRWIS